MNESEKLMKKLKNLVITSTDLVDSGANPEAFIRLLKSNKFEGTSGDEGKSGKNSKKGKEVEPLEHQEKEQKNQVITLTEANQKMLMDLKKWLMSVDFQENEQGNRTVESDGKSVKSSDFESEEKKDNLGKKKEISGLESEVERLRKSLALKELEEISVKYEPLGKKKEELASTFYKMRESGQEVLDEYAKVLDEQLLLMEQSGLFGEIGKRGGYSGVNQLDSATSKLMKSEEISHAQAVMRAYEENPDLAREYEKKYQKSLY